MFLKHIQWELVEQEQEQEQALEATLLAVTDLLAESPRLLAEPPLEPALAAIGLLLLAESPRPLEPALAAIGLLLLAESPRPLEPALAVIEAVGRPQFLEEPLQTRL